MNYNTFSDRQIRLELLAIAAHHRRRCANSDLEPKLRRWHREQAKIISRKLTNRKNAAWTWEKFCEAYR